MVQQGLKYIHGMLDEQRLPFGHQIRVDTAFNRFWCYQLPRNPDCAFHPDRDTAHELEGVHDEASWRSILERVRAEWQSPEAVLHLPQSILEKWRCLACDAQGTPLKFHILGEPFACPICGVAAETTLFNQVTGAESWLESTPATTGLAPLAWVTAVDATDMR